MKNLELVYLIFLTLSICLMVVIVIYNLISKKKIINSKVVNFFLYGLMIIVVVTFLIEKWKLYLSNNP